jgi:hypothetical protein
MKLWGKARTLRVAIRTFTGDVDAEEWPHRLDAERTSNAALQHHRLVISFLHAAAAASVNYYLAL